MPTYAVESKLRAMDAMGTHENGIAISAFSSWLCAMPLSSMNLRMYECIHANKLYASTTLTLVVIIVSWLVDSKAGYALSG